MGAGFYRFTRRKDIWPIVQSYQTVFERALFSFSA